MLLAFLATFNDVQHGHAARFILIFDGASGQESIKPSRDCDVGSKEGQNKHFF